MQRAMSRTAPLVQLVKRGLRARYVRTFLPFTFLFLVTFQIFDIDPVDFTPLLISQINKKIVLATKFYGYKSWNLTGFASDHSSSLSIFTRLQCPISTCSLYFTPFDPYVTQNLDADAAIFHARDLPSPSSSHPLKQPSQKWVFLTLETPFHTGIPLSEHGSLLELIDWTSTYTSDSDIPALYGKYDKFPTESKDKVHIRKLVDKFMRRKGLVAHLVSNCKTPNNRHRYSNALKRHLLTSSSAANLNFVFGNFGKCTMWHSKPIPCSLTDGSCLKNIAKDYQFLLTFENSLCREYITEKFWWNALQHGLIPIVMGGRKADYEAYAPPNSFIHVDDFNNSTILAEYLIRLSKDPVEIRKYLRWKYQGKATSMIQGTDLNTSPYWCNLCAALHSPHPPKKNDKDIMKWWSVEEQCPDREDIPWMDLQDLQLKLHAADAVIGRPRITGHRPEAAAASQPGQSIEAMALSAGGQQFLFGQ
ncbi:hypothetical protein RvY_17305 [Ramazzottius varieornatus]|uniref:Fucosyltransferase n=1 Tax=Ramazzottius varieornatus TaxID=947166 RepID=A0A1D1W2H3_RAMVA|nr:hypothetical protein RvY_17305 [Ramazzottius varieornatus]